MFEYAITAVLFSESVPAKASTAVLVEVPAIRPQIVWKLRCMNFRPTTAIAIIGITVMTSPSPI